MPCVLIDVASCTYSREWFERTWGLGRPEEDHQLHHCCWTGRVSEREEEEGLRTGLYI